MRKGGAVLSHDRKRGGVWPYSGLLQLVFQHTSLLLRGGGGGGGEGGGGGDEGGREEGDEGGKWRNKQYLL